MHITRLIPTENMKRILLLLAAAALWTISAHAVLKEKDLEQTLIILRAELTTEHREQENQIEMSKNQSLRIGQQLIGVLQKSNQNALMLYSQKPDYVFDLTYACHEATEQYRNFQREQLPFKAFINKSQVDIARYDSLITSLKEMQTAQLSHSAKIDRNVCLTLATNIRNTLDESRDNLQEYIRLYEMTEHRLSGLNDYAQKRYSDIQTSIFKNGGDNYFEILKKLKQQFTQTKITVNEKYRVYNKVKSDWDSRMIFGLFGIILLYGFIAALLNQIIFRFVLPKRLQSGEFMKKRTCIIMGTTTITFALILGILRATWDQNFVIMASNLLVEYAWLLGVILISLLLRVTGDQIKSAFRIYTPLIAVGFLVIAFRIILIPNELVNLVFPPILLLCTIWQWITIGRNKQNIPRSDLFYTYISLAAFIVSLCCSWAGYTLLSVQMLIWWIMQLTCILTITCISQWLKLYAERKQLEAKPITQTWFFLFIHHVLLPVMGVVSVMISIYWAADVFNLSDICWHIFNENFINEPNLQVSILKISIVVCLWFFFAYLCSTILKLIRMHYEIKDPSTAESRTGMGKNVIQIFIWGVWLLGSMSLLNISVAWLLAISGGLSTGIGFASKNIIENIFYGASLMTGRIKVGDLIEVNGTTGRVSSISYTSTTVEALSGEVITFQNSQLFTNNYKNLTSNHGYVLAIIPYGVAYGSDLLRVRTVVDEAVNALNNEWMDPSKEARSVVYELGDNSVNLRLYCWTAAIKRGQVISDVMQTIYNTLNSNGIEIPFPQRDLHIKDIEGLNIDRPSV